MTRKCRRCGVQFIVHEPQQDRCFQCAREVADLVSIDTKRRTRFRWAKALEPVTAA